MLCKTHNILLLLLKIEFCSNFFCCCNKLSILFNTYTGHISQWVGTHWERMSILKESRELTGGGQKWHSIPSFLHPWCMERDLIVMSTVIKVTEIDVVLHAAAVSITSQNPGPSCPALLEFRSQPPRTACGKWRELIFSPSFYLSENATDPLNIVC